MTPQEARAHIQPGRTDVWVPIADSFENDHQRLTRDEVEKLLDAADSIEIGISPRISICQVLTVKNGEQTYLIRAI